MIAVSSCACTTAEDVRGEVVNLLAVLVSDDGATSSTGISSQHDAILIFLVNSLILSRPI
jgi:hypothetical protein